ncbi:MAG: methyltransferase domain-containing protein [Actinomycetota bacterium]|nr:methyltransferase domain-containing protein [Actinomycetota bacterium]
MAAPATPERIKHVNERYHDVAAETYDSKWGIDFGEVGRDQVLGKLRKALGRAKFGPFRDGLEIGAGTGYFTLNLLQTGMIAEATATDISPGMLETLEANAERLGLKVTTRVTEAETLPFDDAGFDLVFGHAVLHHIPDLATAFAEFHRVLRPGGAVVFCGEPSRYGDMIAAGPKRAALVIAPLWRRAIGASGRDYSADEADVDGHALEKEVDVHAFSPGELRGVVEGAGFTGVRVKGEELLANMHGWTLRTLEATAVPEEIPWRWRTFAFRSYLALQKADNALLEPHLPPQLFYNLLLSGRKP